MDTPPPAPSPRPSRRSNRALLVLLAIFAAACGALSVGWKRDHDRLACYRAVLDDDNVAAHGDCDH